MKGKCGSEVVKREFRGDQGSVLGHTLVVSLMDRHNMTPCDYNLLPGDACHNDLQIGMLLSLRRTVDGPRVGVVS